MRLLTLLQTPVLCSSSSSCCGVRPHPNRGRWLEQAGGSVPTRPVRLLRLQPLSSLNVCRQNELKVNLSCCSTSDTDQLSFNLTWSCPSLFYSSSSCPHPPPLSPSSPQCVLCLVSSVFFCPPGHLKLPPWQCCEAGCLGNKRWRP